VNIYDLADVETIKPREKFTLRQIDDIELSDEPPYLVDGLVPMGPSFGVIYGPPKSGKTFFATDLFYHVALGREYCGRAVQQGAVIYVTSEGIKGFDRRMIALRRHHDAEGSRAPFYIVNDMPNLGTKNDDIEKLLKKIRATTKQTPIAVLAIDTLARAMGGRNDGASVDMSAFLENCELLSRSLQCFVCAVHHSPRSDDTRLRGSNALDGGADVLIGITKSELCSTARLEELRDGEAGLNWRVKLTAVLVGLDRNQKERFETVAETVSNPVIDAVSETKSKPKLTPEQKRVYDILTDALTDVGALRPGVKAVPHGQKAVTRDDLKQQLVEKGFLDLQKPDSSRARMSKYLNQLAGKKVIGTTAEYVWLPT
jgi:archaellum biogenesis ATPase FlaH